MLPSAAAGLAGHDESLAYRCQFPLLGKPLEVRSNSSAVIAAARRSFGRWSDLPPHLVEPGPLLRLDLVVLPDTAAGLASAAGPAQYAHGGWFLAAGGGALLGARLDDGQAIAFVTAELVARDAHFRHAVVERLGLLLAGHHDRAPVQAGAVVAGEWALLLLGPPAAGTATLCYACLRAGFQLLAADVTYVSVERGLRLWGAPWRIQLPPESGRLFPELRGHAPQPLADGTSGLLIDAAAVDAGRPWPWATAAVLCMLERQRGMGSTLEPIDRRAAQAVLSEQGGRAVSPAIAAALTRDGAYRLSAGSDPAGAAMLLRSLVGMLSN